MIKQGTSQLLRKIQELYRKIEELYRKIEEFFFFLGPAIMVKFWARPFGQAI